MKLLVIGASRGIGRAIVAEALDAGHDVRAFARSASSMDAHDRVELFDGDATNTEDLARALVGMDAVVMALGIKESVSMIWKEVTLFSDATRALLPLMEQHGPKRLIAVTGIGAGDSANALSKPERVGHRIVLSKPYKDKTRQEEMIRDSGVDWTLVRPTVLTNNKASRRYRVMVEPDSWRMGMISRADVADYVVKALGDKSTIGTAPVLAR